MKATTNYNLPLYEPNDLANLSDGYNNAMDILDTSVKAVEDFVQTYDKAIEDNAAAITAETTRATAAENVNADAISAEASRATAAEKVNADAISAEASRAAAAEKVNADNIAAEVTRATAAESAIKNQKYHMVVIGDSFTAKDYTDLTGVWCTPIAKALGVTYHNFAISGKGFLTGDDTTKYTGQINTAKNSSDFDNNLVSWVFICGCLNDMNKDSTQFSAAVRNTISSAQSAFPNAKIVVVGPNTWNSFTLGNNDTTGMSSIYAHYLLGNACVSAGAMFVSTLYMGAGSDKYTNNGHPNSEIQINIARCIFSQLLGITEKTLIATFNVSDTNINYNFTMYIESNGNMSMSGIFTTSSNFTGNAEILFPNNIQVYTRQAMVLGTAGGTKTVVGTPNFTGEQNKTSSKIVFYGCAASNTYYWSAVFPA